MHRTKILVALSSIYVKEAVPARRNAKGLGLLRSRQGESS